MTQAHAQPSTQPSLESFRPLVRRIASQMASRLPASVQIDDLIQVGMLGLMDARERYCDDMGAQFETYAAVRIRGAMLDELRSLDWLPRSVRRAQREIENAIAATTRKLGRAPRSAEVAEQIGISLHDYQALLDEARGSQIVYFASDESDGESPMDRIADSAADDPLAKIEENRLAAELTAGVAALPDREKRVMAMYYQQDMTFKQIARELAVTESRVCQLHTQAVARLRSVLRERFDAKSLPF